MDEIAGLKFLERPSHEGEGPAPALLLLHGVGSHEGDLFRLAPSLDPRFHLFSLRAPVVLGPGSYGWFHVEFTPQGSVIEPEEAEASRRALIAFIEALPAARGIDPRRVYSMGFSQGAIMTLALVYTRPDLLAGAVALAGRTLPELFAEEGPLAGHLAPPEALEGLPVFVGHGLHDEVLGVHHARATRERLQAYPVRLTYREYDMGHFIGEACLEEVRRWLAERLEEAP